MVVLEMTSQYLYCVVNTDESVQFETGSVGPEGQPVKVLPGEGMGVVVSTCAPAECQMNRHNLLAHQKVMEEAMSRFTVLPICYGTVAEASTLQQAETLVRKRVLVERQKELQGLLSDLGGRQEMSVKVLWRDLDGVFKQIGGSDPEVRRLRERIGARSGAASRPDRIRLGGLVKESFERNRDRLAGQLVRSLSPPSVRHNLHTPLGDRMVLNGAFLVERAERARFDSAVEALVACHPELAFRYVGPMPASSFVSLTISWT